MFVEDLFSFLASAGTDAGSRFYPNRLPQKLTLPAARYFRVSNPQEHTHSGAMALQYPRFQLDCYAEKYLGAVAFAEQVVAALNGYVGVMGSHSVKASFVEDAGKDDYDPETNRHRVMVDVVIWNKEI